MRICDSPKTPIQRTILTKPGDKTYWVFEKLVSGLVDVCRLGDDFMAFRRGQQGLTADASRNIWFACQREGWHIPKHPKLPEKVPLAEAYCVGLEQMPWHDVTTYCWDSPFNLTQDQGRELVLNLYRGPYLSDWSFCEVRSVRKLYFTHSYNIGD